MDANKPDLLATFVERHRADFDVHEPRPDLWAVIESQLHPGAKDAPLRTPAVTILPETADASAIVTPVVATAPASAAPWWQRYGVAAGLVLLVGAAGLSEAWRSRLPAAPALATAHRPAAPAALAAAAALAPEPDPADPDPAVQVASLRPGPAAADSQLTAAVRGLEAYYTAQLAPRRAALLRLDTARTGTPAAWQQQLLSLDASYRQLRQELWHHPQPEVLLTAMNRNLQVRLDLLDQQLRRSTAAARDATASRARAGYLVADSRRQP